MSLLSKYRENWPRVGALIGAGVAGATALGSGRLTRPQTMSALNFVALMAHQYEEYEDPGYFPGQFNGGILHSDEPDHYPLNTNTAMLINVPMAYAFYGLPVLFPKNRVLGMAPVFFGFMQAVTHGVVFPRLAGDRYSPGFLAASLLHTPIGISYLRALDDEEPLRRSELAKAAAYTVVFAFASIPGPNLALKDKNSPYRFTAEQMGPHLPPGGLDPAAPAAAS